MSSGPTDDELRNKAEDRRDEMGRTADNLNDLADDIDDAADLAGDARDYDARLTGLFGATLDSDVDTFQYTADALGNFRSVVGNHITSLAGLHDKVDRNRREFLMAGGAATAATIDYTNLLGRDSRYSGHFNEGPTDEAGGNFDLFGLIGEQPDEPPTDQRRDRPEFQAGESYSLGEPDNFDSVIRDDSDFYEWVEQVDYKVDDLGVRTYSRHDGVNGRVRELVDYDEDNDLAILGETVLGHLEPEDLNQRRIDQ